MQHAAHTFQNTYSKLFKLRAEFHPMRTVIFPHRMMLYFRQKDLGEAKNRCKRQPVTRRGKIFDQ